MNEGPKTKRLQETWAALADAAISFSGGDINDVEQKKMLAKAARAYAAAHADLNPPKATSPAAPPTSSTTSLRFGREKGVRLRDMKTNNLKWARDFLAEQIELNANPRFQQSNQQQHDAIVAELNYRGE